MLGELAVIAAGKRIEVQSVTAKDSIEALPRWGQGNLIDGVYDSEAAAQELKAAQAEARYESMSEKQLAREIRALERQMLELARNLEFEKAAKARDQLAELRKRVFGVELASE